MTLAFGFTLIGVAQDYPLHVLSHRRADRAPRDVARALWPTLATGVASTCIAYLAFLFSGVDRARSSSHALRSRDWPLRGSRAVRAARCWWIARNATSASLRCSAAVERDRAVCRGCAGRRRAGVVCAASSRSRRGRSGRTDLARAHTRARGAARCGSGVARRARAPRTCVTCSPSTAPDDEAGARAARSARTRAARRWWSAARSPASITRRATYRRRQTQRAGRRRCRTLSLRAALDAASGRDAVSGRGVRAVRRRRRAARERSRR